MLASIEKRLQVLEKGKARVDDEAEGSGSDSSENRSITYKDWSGWDL